MNSQRQFELTMWIFAILAVINIVVGLVMWGVN